MARFQELLTLAFSYAIMSQMDVNDSEVIW
jgi:hypothetical protein